jgi:transposase
LRTRHTLPLLAMRRTENGSGLGRWRWVVERTFAWLNQFRRLRVRYDKWADIHEAFLSLGCAWICWQSLRKAGRWPENSSQTRFPAWINVRRLLRSKTQPRTATATTIAIPAWQAVRLEQA